MSGMKYKFIIMPCIDLLMAVDYAGRRLEIRLRGHARGPCPKFAAPFL